MLTYLKIGETYETNDILEYPDNVYIVRLKRFGSISSRPESFARAMMRERPIAGELVLEKHMAYRPRRYAPDPETQC